MSRQQPEWMTGDELALRWRVSLRTLERWRHNGKGPAWLRLPGRVINATADVEANEARHLQDPDW